ncbi:hypothetical protein J2T04_001562 [Chryseobacterium lathyri]|uniref:Uncharacterized protein n=1 Tax=Chryseobacterium lathyri TaxID=395933 RepID=A0ABT9SK54_9FLAO|nr:hypothetical protein [Chryseobacterium lathyri]
MCKFPGIIFVLNNLLYPLTGITISCILKIPFLCNKAVNFNEKIRSNPIEYSSESL